MLGKRYYWLKLQEDFFSCPQIKKLRRIAGGDTFTIIYLKMQLLSIKSGGVIEYQGIESSFEEELSLILDEDLDNVKVTVAFLVSQGLIEQSDDRRFLLTQAAKNIGTECESAARVRAFRKQAQEKALHCNADVTQCNENVTLDIDKELDRENREEKNTYMGGAETAPPRKTDDPPIISLVLNDKSEYPVTQKDIDKWSSLYPAVNILQELRKMAGWLDANPTKRKTRMGIKRFVNNWLSREQDRGMVRRNEPAIRHSGSDDLDFIPN